MSNMLRIAALFVLVLCASLSCAQLVPPGGETPPTHGSGQWWDPASWQITATAVGEVRNKSWVYNENQEVVPFNQTLTWQQAKYHGKCANSTYVNKNIETESEGTVTFNLQYIGTAPLQDKILVLIDSNVIAQASNFPNGNYIVDNGIGSPAVQGARGGFFAQGQKYRLVQIGSNGQGSFQIELYAKAFTSGANISAEVFTHQPNVVIADKAVGVAPWLGTTYYAKPAIDPTTGQSTFIQEPNDMSDPTDYRITSAFVAPPLWIGGTTWASGIVSSALLGNWIPYPEPEITFSPSYAGNTEWGYVSSSLFSSELLSMILSGMPREESLYVSASQLGILRNGKVDIEIYPPITHLAQISNNIVKKNAVSLYSGQDAVLPGEQITVTVQTGVTDSVTQALQLGGSTQLTGNLSDIIELAVGLNAGFTQGNSASISTTVSITRTFTNHSPYVVYPKLVQSALERQIHFTYHAYGSNGFQGVFTGQAIDFRSSTRELAEAEDHVREWVALSSL